ncbi:MAG TPA: hypothetical protein PKC24_01535 [Cyclobacteriaceae bacterium]|nr:hypothetical protein [Cyclobacteriaceae bacterium]
MHPILRNILAVIAGILGGGIINMGIIMLGSIIVPAPAGTDTSTPEGLQAAMPLFEFKHFVMPFLAHASGTFAGACLAVLIAVKRKMVFAMIIGIYFLAAGAYMVSILPSPLWFNITDLTLAYLPSAYLAGIWLSRKSD